MSRLGQTIEAPRSSTLTSKTDSADRERAAVIPLTRDTGKAILVPPTRRTVRTSVFPSRDTAALLALDMLPALKNGDSAGDQQQHCSRSAELSACADNPGPSGPSCDVFCRVGVGVCSMTALDAQERFLAQPVFRTDVAAGVALARRITRIHAQQFTAPPRHLVCELSVKLAPALVLHTPLETGFRRDVRSWIFDGPFHGRGFAQNG